MPTGKRKEVAGHTISIDLGGTKMLAAVVDGQDQIVGRAKMKTLARQGVDEVIQRHQTTTVGDRAEREQYSFIQPTHHAQEVGLDAWPIHQYRSNDYHL